MPHIVNPLRYKSKKAFKEAVLANPGQVYCDDPSIFGDAVSGSVTHILEKKSYFTVTNHPKRSWFAMVAREGGKIKVT